MARRGEPVSLAQALAWIRWRISEVWNDFEGEGAAAKWNGSLSYDPIFSGLPSLKNWTVISDPKEPEGQKVVHAYSVEACAPGAAVKELLTALQRGQINATWLRQNSRERTAARQEDWRSIQFTSDLGTVHERDRSTPWAHDITVDATAVRSIWKPKSVYQTRLAQDQQIARVALNKLLDDPATFSMTKEQIWEKLPVAMSRDRKQALWEEATANRPERKRPGPRRQRPQHDPEG